MCSICSANCFWLTRSMNCSLYITFCMHLKYTIFVYFSCSTFIKTNCQAWQYVLVLTSHQYSISLAACHECVSGIYSALYAQILFRQSRARNVTKLFGKPVLACVSLCACRKIPIELSKFRRCVIKENLSVVNRWWLLLGAVACSMFRCNYGP